VSADVLIYLHGFNSSPESFKATKTRNFLATYYPDIELVMPQIALTPMAAWQQLDALLAQYKGRNIAFIGSSLGGFLATLLSNKYGGKAVLVNPAVRPSQLIDILIGDYTNPYTGVSHAVTQAHGDELHQLQFEQVAVPKNYWVLLQQGDETLDYRQALSCYQGSRITVEPLGDHSFVGFERYLNAIVEFLFKNRR